ncbi:hypothetical protein [Vulcanisaeta souniana]|uniref:hypothetical protein n=1 Tax=Vulcanisaeta souniana TaxID=164452 RepID=UPI0006D29C41|nr:hypothetical protein [Vulcanisaeta souniana]
MRVIYLALIALGIVMAVVYLGHAIAWPSLSIPNPLNEKLSVNTQGVVQLYITALELNALGNYTGALSITKVLGITAAVKVSPLISQLHNYEAQLTNYLVELRSIYNEMVNSISLGNYTGARSLAIEGLLIDSEADNELNAILSMLNNIAPGSAGQVISAAQSIRQYLIGLNETFINVLTSNYTRTELTVNATPSTVVVGSPVTVYGVLTTINGVPIPNATINIYVGGVTTLVGH